MADTHPVLLVMDVQPGVVTRLDDGGAVLVDKVFPRQALVTSVADWASQLAGPG